MYRILVIVGILLCALGYSVPDAHAQQPAPPPTITDAARDVLATLRRVEAEQQAQAIAWAAQRQLPLTTHDQKGQRIALVGLNAGRPTYLTTRNLEAAQTTHTIDLHPGAALGLNLTGHNLDIGLWDAGIPLETHQELAGRVTVRNGVAADDHATHVAGTLAATGLRTDARGMAYEATIRAYDWNNDATEMATEAERGVLLSNHSYGIIAGWHYGDLEGAGDQWYWLGDASVSDEEDYLFGWYDVEAAQFDRVAFSQPYLLPVVAAGNDRADDGPISGTYRALTRQGDWHSYDAATEPHQPDGGPDGFDTISGAAVAKNVLTVGSIHLSSGPPSASTFSSFGPTDDGRIKPDLVGHGERVLSTLAADPLSYGLSSGTSMATPNVAGTLVLLQEHYYNLTGRSLRGASLKGLALHTADDIGTPGPDYRHGWGLLNAAAAATQLSDVLANNLALLETHLDDGTIYAASATVEEAGPLRVTLSWTDRPSARRPITSASLDDPYRHLRNDLDLRIINDATGTVYQPYTLDPDDPLAPAVPGDNRVDPMEQIYLPHAQAGDYTMSVSHKGTLVSGEAQPFTLIVTGARQAVRPVVVSHLNVAEETVERVHLTWMTPFERSTGAFVVRRAPVTYYPNGSREIGAFAVVGNLDVPGSSEQERSYAFNESHVPSGRYIYRIFFEGPDMVYLTGETDVNVPVPADYAILSTYPNPFADRTNVVLDLPAEETVTLEVYDVLGRRVTHVFSGTLPAGRHEHAIDAASWAPGVYFARLITSNAVRTHRMVVMR